MSTHENSAHRVSCALDRHRIAVRIVAITLALVAGALGGLVSYLVLGAL
jgi:hypothetical protein